MEMLCRSLKDISGSILELAYTSSVSILTESGVLTLGTNSSEFMYLECDLELLVTYNISNRFLDSNQWSSYKS